MLTGHYISGSLYREPYKIKSLHGSSWFWACPTMERYKIGSWWAPLSSEVWNRVIQALKNYIYFDKNTLWLCEHVEWHVCSGILLLQFKYEWNKHFFSTRDFINFKEHYIKHIIWFGFHFSCRDLCKQPILIRAGGGIYNYLYQLRSSSDEAGQPKFELSSILGKFQITWRTNLGEPGRLQTQNIHSTVSEVPASVLKILLLCSGTLLLLVTVTLSLILSSSFYAPSLLNCFHCI